MRRAARAPLPLLGGLLALYLLVPIAAFCARLGDGAAAQPGLAGALATSALTASASAAIVALLGTPLAFLLARARGRGAALLGVLVQLPLALPPLISGILLLYVVGPHTPVGRLFGGGLTDSAAGIVLAQTFVAAPFLIVAGRSAFAAVDPALDDVAATLGHGPLARFARVHLPIALPGLAAGLLLTWLRAFGEFGATVILAYHPYSLPVYTFVQFNAGGLETTMLPVAMALLAALLVLLAALAAPRLWRRRRTRLPAPRPPSPRPAPPLSFALRRRLGEFELDLAYAAQSRRLALLGPSGAGKTLALRSLAGLQEQPPRGRPRSGRGRHFNRHAGAMTTAPGGSGMRIGYVPQDACLLPRRSVWRQVNLGVEVDPGRAAWWLRELELEGLADRRAEELSGGQRRRVALARALAADPALLLLDEPFAGLDAPVRDRLRRRLRELQLAQGLSTVTVTHDPEEAALLADEVLVLRDGRLAQAGPRREVFARPASPEVAALLGIANLNGGEVAADGLLRSHGVAIEAPTAGLPPGAPVSWCVRPEQVRLTPAGAHPAALVDEADLGAVRELRLRLGDGLELLARVPHGAGGPGSAAACRVDLPAAAITLWPDAGASSAARRAGRARGGGPRAARRPPARPLAGFRAG